MIAPGLAMATVTPEFAAYPTLPFAVSGYAVPALADIDGDGDLDAFVGDEVGDLTYFERSGGSSSMTFAAGTINAFGIVNVGNFAAPAFVDIDGDGDQDLFVGNASGSIRFFENTGASSSPSFSSPLLDPFGLTPVDYHAAPAFADLDGDGDFDALVGEQNGNLRYFENTGTPSSPAFGPAQINPFGFLPVGIYSKAALADLDGDGDFDLLVSDDWLANCVYFQNAGTPGSPSFAPGIASPYGLEAIDTISAPAFGDLDGDGDLEVIVGALFGETYFFENIGDPSSPQFVFALHPYGLTHVGERPEIEFGDLDGDGDLDALVGAFHPRLYYFENVGGPTSPKFAAPVQDPFGIDTTSLMFSPIYLSPELADMDSDGDLDLFVGTSVGFCEYVENVGSATAPSFAAPEAQAFGLGGSLVDCSPELGDIDGDGDIDAFVGDSSGQFLFFENIGTPMAPAFATPIDVPFGLTNLPASTFRFPVLCDLDFDDDLDILLGGGPGIVYFENTGTRSSPLFAPPVDNPFGIEGTWSAPLPALGDIDGDRDLDLIVGDSVSGEISLIRGVGTVPIVPGCTATPDICQEGFLKAALTIKETRAGREKMKARFLKGPALQQADFGDPTSPGGAIHRLCFYAADGELAGGLVVDRAGNNCDGSPCWRASGGDPPDGNGFRYRDRAASASGVGTIKARSGAPGRSTIVLNAANSVNKQQAALPIGIASALAGNASATMQYRVSHVGCMSVELTNVKKSDADVFSARE